MPVRISRCLFALSLALGTGAPLPVLAADNAGSGRGDAAFRLTVRLDEYRLSGASTKDRGAPANLPRKAAALTGLVDSQARAKGLDPNLVHAVIKAESGYQPQAVSLKGAVGLMQVMPDTGQRFGVGADRLDDPKHNLQAGTSYLRFLMNRYGDVSLALAAYNAGEGAVAKYGNTIPPYPETQAYVKAILKDYRGDPISGTQPRIQYADGTRLMGTDMAAYRVRWLP